ncbi:MAG: hypothetical protein RLN75_07490, partial [Longimicrobiales bacterium]
MVVDAGVTSGSSGSFPDRTIDALMESPMPISRIALVALVSALSACSEGIGPGTEDGTYALMEVDGTSPPVQVANETWIADTIRLARGDWTRVSVVTQHGEGTDVGPARRESDGFIR